MRQTLPHILCSYATGGTVPDVVTSISTAITGVVGRETHTDLRVVTRKKKGGKKDIERQDDCQLIKKVCKRC